MALVAITLMITTHLSQTARGFSFSPKTYSETLSVYRRAKVKALTKRTCISVVSASCSKMGIYFNEQKSSGRTTVKSRTLCISWLMRNQHSDFQDLEPAVVKPEWSICMVAPDIKGRFTVLTGLRHSYGPYTYSCRRSLSSLWHGNCFGPLSTRLQLSRVAVVITKR